MSLILRVPWTVQPQSAARASGAVFAWAGGLHDRQRGVLPTVTSSVAQPGPLGQSIYTVGGSNLSSVNRYSFPAQTLSNLFGSGKPTTIILQFRAINLTTGLGVVAGLGLPTANRLAFYIQAATSGNFAFGSHVFSFATATWTGAGLSAGNHTVAITHDGGSTARLVINGRDWGTQTFAASNFPTDFSNQSLHLGAGNVSGASNNFWGAETEISAFLAFDRLMPASQLANVTASPNALWQVFEPRRITIPVSAGAAPTFNPAWAIARNSAIVGAGVH